MQGRMDETIKGPTHGTHIARRRGVDNPLGGEDYPHILTTASGEALDIALRLHRMSSTVEIDRHAGSVRGRCRCGCVDMRP
jgi:hypothetical protein